MTAIDWIIIAFVLVSFVYGVVRGFVREVVSLAGWLAGAYLALRFAPALSAYIPLDIEWPVVKTVLAGALIFVLCVFVAALIGFGARGLLVAVKLSLADRALGGVFGLARGVLIVALAVWLARDSQVARQRFWLESATLPRIEVAVRFVAQHLPIEALALAGGH
jgi:membrane protein required for colicin V production